MKLHFSESHSIDVGLTLNFAVALITNGDCANGINSLVVFFFFNLYIL